ncbi:MAG: DUF4331 domain-containing protein [Chloroflexales bacterium]|nr:DUF4331 domain-containing protein [Chloroflexales bacterium]
MTPLVLIASALIGFGPAPAGASSHREAPLISKDPSVDNTDTYAFVSPDAQSTVTLISNWIPFEEPGGGPNFYHFDDNALYNIKIDRDGDAKPDVTYEWTFRTVIKNPNTFLYNTGPIASPTSTTFNYTQYYTVTRYLGDNTDISGVRATNGTVLFGNKLMVPDNIGPRSTPSYEALAAQFINVGSGPANGYKEFTGQREDPFYVDVNSIFDLAGLRPFNSLHLIPLPNSTGLDSTAGYNVHSTIIQVPITELAPACPATGGATSTNCVVGVWSTADRPQVTTRGGILGITGEAGSGPYVQVSRLGMPLTNEVVLPLALKDAFNGLKPERDTPLFNGSLAGASLGTLAANSVTRPELQQLLPVLYPKAFRQTANSDGPVNLPALPRTDLLTIFLTGIPGVNMQANSGNPFDPATATKIASDQLRLNVAIKPTTGVCQGNRLGPLASSTAGEGSPDLAGFPNGRRLEDDVTDIALRAVAGGYGTTLAAAPFNLPNFTPGNLLNDGVSKNDKPCLSGFPYVGTPHQGYNRIHAAIYTALLPIAEKERGTGGTR